MIPTSPNPSAPSGQESSPTPVTPISPVMLDTSTDRGRHVAQRLTHDRIAWLTTVRAGGQPDSVPVWFLWQAGGDEEGDGTLLLFSQPGTPKERNIGGNPQISFTLDDTRVGSDVVRIEGIARVVERHAPAHTVPGYVAKYAESISYIGFDDAEAFAEVYSTAIIITPTRYRI